MPAYDTSFTPPAPIADVSVSHPVTGLVVDGLRGKLDSGADVSVIPTTLVDHLHLTPRGHVWTRGYDGTFTRRPLYYVGMNVEGINVPVVRCVAANRADLLLGRNVMNRFCITLDGKNLTFELLDP